MSTIRTMSTIYALTGHLEVDLSGRKSYGPRGICHQVPPIIQNTTTGQTQNTNTNQTQSGTQATTGASTTQGSTAAQSAEQGNAAQQQAAQNTYTAGQQALQGQATTGAGQFLQTGIAPGLQQEIAAENAAYQQNFNTDVAPQLAAQYGAGSPVIGGQEEMGLVNLISNAYQNQGANYNAALGTAGSLAFNPTGTTGESTSQQSGTNTSGTQNEQGTSQQQNSSWQQAMNEAQNMTGASNTFGITS